jgi:hypothetical protein
MDISGSHSVLEKIIPEREYVDFFGQEKTAVRALQI